jgi:hypothetical protein
MLAHPPGREPRRPIARSGGARLGRLAAVLAALTGAVLAPAAVTPAAWAGIAVPGPGGPYGPAGVPPAPQTGVPMITAGGMAGWQIALIAAGAAVVAAAAAVRLDRSLTTRRAGLVIAARRFRPARAAPRPARPPARTPPTERPVHRTQASRPPPHQARQTSWSSAPTSPGNRAACPTTASAEPRRQRARQDARSHRRLSPPRPGPFPHSPGPDHGAPASNSPTSRTASQYPRCQTATRQINPIRTVRHQSARRSIFIQNGGSVRPCFKQGLITHRARGVLLPGCRPPTVNALQGCRLPETLPADRPVREPICR